MRPFKELYFRLTHATPERKASRSNLRKARNGDAEAFLALAAHYFDLALIYLGTCREEAVAARTSRIETLFTSLWRKIAYAERVSDFEFMLERALSENAPEDSLLDSPEALVGGLRSLNAQSRFALIAHDLENWPLRWVALLMRMRPMALHQLLSETRCALCSIDWQSLAKEERSCLVDVSISMASCPNPRANKALYRRILNFPRVIEIKSLWLELRPDLVEVRYRYLLEPDQREQMLRNLFSHIQASPRDEAPLIDRVVNSVHFSRHGKIKVS